MSYFESILTLGFLSMMIIPSHYVFIHILKGYLKPGDHYVTLIVSPFLWYVVFSSIFNSNVNGPELLLGIGGLFIYIFVTFKTLTDRSFGKYFYLDMDEEKMKKDKLWFK